MRQPHAIHKELREEERPRPHPTIQTEKKPKEEKKYRNYINFQSNLLSISQISAFFFNVVITRQKCFYVTADFLGIYNFP